MPNKKKQRNSFYFFMKEKQEEFARKGLKYNMKQISEIAHPLWKDLSIAQKQKYEDMAKEYKLEYQITGRMAADGTLISENEREKEEREQMEKKMRQDITDMVIIPGASKECCMEMNRRRKTYFLTFNILCCVKNVDPRNPHKTINYYIPNEVGIVEYTIKDGITGEYHRFINSGEIPIGYTGGAKSHSDETHQIPLSGHEDGERDFRKVWKEILDFINPPASRTDNPVPVFCLKDDMLQTEGSLKWLATKANCQDEFEKVQVYDASYLFYELRKCADHEVASYAVAEGYLKKNSFDYTPNSRCPFHEDLDSPYCALGYAKRLSFLISDSICCFFGVEPTMRHLPQSSSTDRAYEVHLPRSQNIRATEQGIGRGFRLHSDSSADMESLSLYDRVHSTTSERTDSRLHERIEPNRYMGTTLTRSSDSETKTSVASNSDSENSPPSASVRTTPSHTAQTASDTDSTIELRQPAAPSIAMSFALAARGAPAVVPGKGIGRGQRKLK